MNKMIQYGFSVLFFMMIIVPSYAKDNMDKAISDAAKDITGNCKEEMIVAIDDFETPSKKMTMYIREELADSLFAEDSSVQIVTREHMDKIEKELRFQNSGVVSEKTMISVAERLGAQVIIFGKLEVYDKSYSLRVKMIDVKTGSYVFRKTYDFNESEKVKKLLGTSQIKRGYTTSVGLFTEVDKDSLDYFLPEIGLRIDYGQEVSIGLKIPVVYDFNEGKNELQKAKILGTLRCYFFPFNVDPSSGLYAEVQWGITLTFTTPQIWAGSETGVGAGFRFTVESIYIEPDVGYVYPSVYYFGISAGMRY